MAFELLMIQRKPATISVRRRKDGWQSYLSVDRALLGRAGAGPSAAYDVLIGTDDDAGKLRLRVSKTGSVRGRAIGRGGGRINFCLGLVGAFPACEVDRQRCAGAAIGDDTIEITLPDWSALAEDDEAYEAGDVEAPAAQARRPVNGKGTASAPAKVQPAPRGFSKNGVTLDFTRGAETVTYQKKTMDLTARQAAVLAALLRAAPAPVGRGFIGSNALAEVPQHMRDASLDLIASDLKKALAGIGLELKTIKGVGLALAVGAG